MVGCNDNIMLENKLNVSEFRIYQWRQFKSNALES
jgi:hypothetical protein